MTLSDLATGTAGPRWAHALAYVLLLGGFALTLYQRADDVFHFTNTTLEENRRHFDEDPIEASVMVPGIGQVTLQYFASDRCTRIFRDDMMTAKWVTYDEFVATGWRLELVPGLLAQGAPSCIPAEAHREAPSTEFGERRGEMVQVFYHFPDRCEGWTWCHVSGSFCETHKDGTLAMHWTRCVH